jgi:hypothetical protein
VSRENQPVFDVEFNHFYGISVQQRYYASSPNLYVKMKERFGEKTGNIRILETTFGTNGDDNFWTTPVIRDVAGGTMAITISLVPGIIPRPDRTIAQQLSDGFSVDFLGKTFPVKCEIDNLT